MPQAGLHIEVDGTVQGVGYRPWVYQVATRIGIGGRVWNHSRGVSIDAHGDGEALQRFVTVLRSEAPPAASVRSVACEEIAFHSCPTFAIDDSVASGERRVSIPADLATCDDCLRELLDPADRRYRYPFINCTNCGPRYSIVTGAPYDRAKTSMAGFAMCDDCRCEYDSPLDRRFHAQPNACPRCGPQLSAVTPEGRELPMRNPVAFAARALRAGLIVAVKGLGGFHLACDATSKSAVQRLRDRKRRDAKPFAIMVRDLAAAETLAVLTDTDRELLASAERPIVLAKGRGEPLVGLLLPYTPLHHLLLRDAAIPLVMTSGNAGGEPMVTTNEEALRELGGIADVFLLHDRDIVTRVDDSIVRAIAGAPVVFRRARGFVPRAVELARPLVEPILACGAHLKNTFCLAEGSRAFLGPHIGDLESVATLHAYETAIERMKAFTGIEPRLLAHDLHPDYFSTRYALAQEGVPTIGVQHHHAHIAAVMAEHALEGPVIGVAYDGTGFGTDGTSWGAEILVATPASFERFATFRPIPLPGGDAAIRQPWRAALALLDDTFDGDPPLAALPLFRRIARTEIDNVRRMVARNFNTTPARGIGRYFDAIGSLVLDLPIASYEGEVALRWNLAADDAERGRYPIVFRNGAAPREVDPRTIVRGAVYDLLGGKSAGTISARFHNTLAAATVEIVRAALAVHGELPVVLAGGCFQNARLTEAIVDGLRPYARIHLAGNVPPGDGGIALGQAVVAGARLRAGLAAQPSIEEAVACV